jgi:hypothetical protein
MLRDDEAPTHRPGISQEADSVDVAATLAALEARVAALEEVVSGRSRAVAADEPISTAYSDAPTPDPHADAAVAIPTPRLPALGRSVLVLAGAFLLRAITEAGVVAGAIGAALGVAYAVFVVYLADRAAGAGRRSSASFLSLAAVFVAYPFVWETTTNLGLMRPAAAAGVLVLVTSLGVAVSVRHRLRGSAWAFVAGAMATATGLSWSSGAPSLFAALIIALGVTTVWLGYLCSWTGSRWPAAVFANALVLVLVLLALRATMPSGLPHPARAGVLLLALVLPAAYLVSFGMRTLSGRHEAGIFEILQSLGCLGTGLVGAILLRRAGGEGYALIGWPAVAVGAGSYAIAFAFVRRRQGRGLNFFYYAWLGLLLTLLGTALVVPSGGLPYLWSVLGIVAGVTGGHFDRWTLRLHCAAYLTGSVVVTGLPQVAFDTFFAPAARSWHNLRAPGLMAWLAAGSGYVLLVATQRRRTLAAWRRLPRFLLALVVLTGAGSLLVSGLVTWLDARTASQAQSLVAVIRTIVLAATVILLAAGSRHSGLIELGWLVNPLLVVAGAKLLLEDLRSGTPITLGLSFACFGVALILAPRLRRRLSAARNGSVHVREAIDETTS